MIIRVVRVINGRAWNGPRRRRDGDTTSGAKRQMKRLPFVVVSACVLALGLRLYADSTFAPEQGSRASATPAAPAQQSPSSPAIPVAAQPGKPAMASSHAPASTDESQTALVKQYC